MNTALVFLLGMIGALAPEIVRLYSIRHSPAKFRWSWFYAVVSLGFAALGGTLALVLPATTYWGALYVGVTTPVLVTSIAKKAREATLGGELRGPSDQRLSPVDSFLHGL
jgi:hypothetical protein